MGYKLWILLTPLCEFGKELSWAFQNYLLKMMAVFWCMNKVKSMRVSPESEEEGLHVPEFGMSGYPEDAVVPVGY